jgi:hypothetical protein
VGLAHGQPFGGALAVDGALDLEQGDDPAHGLERQGRDDDRRLAMLLRGDVGEHEELAPGVGPARRLEDRSGTSLGAIERAKAGIGVRLQDARPSLQMALGMLGGSSRE